MKKLLEFYSVHGIVAIKKLSILGGLQYVHVGNEVSKRRLYV